MSRAPTTTEGRALALLGAGHTPEQVAAACGVTVSRISQLLSDENFTSQVAELRFSSLSKYNELDNKYDAMEDKLVSKLEDLFPMMMRPMEVMKAISVINGAKRRGQSASEQVTNQQTTVSIVMPTVIVNKFVTNIHNQVIQAGTQELLTIQSGSLLREAQAAQAAQLERGTQNAEITGISNRAAESSGAGSSSRSEASSRSLPALSQQEESSFNPAGRFIPA